MKPPRALLLFDTTVGADLLRSTLLDEGYEFDEAPLADASVPADGYCLAVVNVRRVAQPLIELASAWRDAGFDATLVAVPRS